MTIEKKTIRSDIPGSHVFLNASLGYAGSPAEEMRRLIVTRDISVKGAIEACSYLVIEGRVEADDFSARRLDILDGGLFTGTAEVQDCVIAGRFDGKLTVHGRLTVKPTGHILGDVEYGALEVETGARIEGQINSLHTVRPTEEPARLAALPPAQTPPLASNVEPLFAEEDTAEETVITGRASAYRRAGRF